MLKSEMDRMKEAKYFSSQERESNQGLQIQGYVDFQIEIWGVSVV